MTRANRAAFLLDRRELVVVTDRRQAHRPLAEVIAAVVAAGARVVLLREKDLPRAERAALAGQLREVLAPVGGHLIVAGPDPLGGDAIHLAAADPLPLIMGGARGHAGDTPKPGHDQRDEVGVVGRSCHSAGELDRLTVEDYVTVSPVFASTSKPGYGPALGPDGLGALCRRTDRPVLALGGVETAAQVAACLDAGAAGVAVMGAVMRAADPAAAVQELSRRSAGIAEGGKG